MLFGVKISNKVTILNSLGSMEDDMSGYAKNQGKIRLCRKIRGKISRTTLSVDNFKKNSGLLVSENIDNKKYMTSVLYC